MKRPCVKCREESVVQFPVPVPGLDGEPLMLTTCPAHALEVATDWGASDQTILTICTFILDATGYTRAE